MVSSSLDQRKRRRVRPDDDARDDVAEHHRLLETVEQHRHQSGDDHHDREVGKKGRFVHGNGRRKTHPPLRSSCPGPINAQGAPAKF